MSSEEQAKFLATVITVYKRGEYQTVEAFVKALRKEINKKDK